MISLPHAVKIYVCTAAVDMRKSFDGLCGLAEHVMREDPLSGHLFVFRNRRRDRLKVMYWDHDGLAIWYKRLESGGFELPSDLHSGDDTPASVSISVSQLNLLLGGIDLASARQRKRYRLEPQTP